MKYSDPLVFGTILTLLEAAQGANDCDVLRNFIAEHDGAVYSVMNDAFWHQVAKISGELLCKPGRAVVL